MTIWRTQVRACTPTPTHTHTHTQICNTLFPRQRWFQERASMLHCSYIACLMESYLHVSHVESMVPQNNCNVNFISKISCEYNISMDFAYLWMRSEGGHQKFSCFVARNTKVICVFQFHCCGVTNYEDWYLIEAWPGKRNVPSSCCLPEFANNTSKALSEPSS